MKKSSMNPGQVKACQHITDRVYDTVSSAEQIAVSETGRNVLSRTWKQTPDNEEQIRQTPLRINAEVYGIIVRMAGQEAVDKTVDSGLLVVA